ncbi:MAG TPA: hypothetical protein DCP28_37585, partial [Cytophagales bacterium]|nr:hypothetical protein [Cytophagales bacterium]
MGTAVTAKRFFLLLFLSFLTHLAIGQNYRPGYVILNNGDSLIGKISYYQAKRVLPKLYFMAQGEGYQGVVEYRPGEVQYFGFDEGGLFTGFSREDGQRFMEVLVNGPMTVLNTLGYYVIRQENIGEDVLFFKKKKIRTNERNYFLNPFYNNQYLLSSWENNCHDTEATQDKVVSSEALLRWASKYNDCIGANYQVEGTEKTGFKLDVGGIFGGFSGTLNNKFLGDVALGNTDHSIGGNLSAWSLELRYTWLSPGAYVRMTGESFEYSIAGEGTFTNQVEGKTLHVANIDMRMVTTRYSVGYDIPLKFGSGWYIAPEAGISVNIPVDEITYEVSRLDMNDEVIRTANRARDYRVSPAFIGYSGG